MNINDTLTKIINAMSYSRRDAIRQVAYQSPKFVEHVAKLLCYPHYHGTHGWAIEVYNFAERAAGFTGLKGNDKMKENVFIGALCNNADYADNVRGMFTRVKKKMNKESWKPITEPDSDFLLFQALCASIARSAYNNDLVDGDDVLAKLEYFRQFPDIATRNENPKWKEFVHVA